MRKFVAPAAAGRIAAGFVDGSPDESTAALVARELFLRTFLSSSAVVAGKAAARIASLVSDTRLKAGQTLYRDGEASDEVYFIVEGELELQSASRSSWRFGPRSMVGMIDAAHDRPRTRTAVAVRDSHLLSMRTVDWLDLLEDEYEFAEGAIHNISRAVTTAEIVMRGRGFDTSPKTAVSIHPGPLGFVDRTLLLRAAAPFRRASVQATVDLIEHTRVHEFPPGAQIIARGAEKTELLVVATGKVTLSFDDNHIVFEPGTLLGGIACLAPEPWSFDARAGSDAPARLLAIDKEDFFDAMEEHFDLVRATIAELTDERERLQAFQSEQLEPPLVGADPVDEKGAIAEPGSPPRAASDASDASDAANELPTASPSAADAVAEAEVEALVMGPDSSPSASS